jgi:hypothetical protein
VAQALLWHQGVFWFGISGIPCGYDILTTIFFVSQGRGSSDDDRHRDNRRGVGGSQNKGADLGNNKQMKHVFVVGMEGCVMN